MPIYKQTTEITNIDDLLSSVERDIEEVYFGDKNVFTMWGEYDGTLPAQYSANGSALADYRIYGASGGVGDDSGTAYGYVVDMSVSDGATSTTTQIYIGSSPLNAYEYIDYASDKIYRWSNNQLSVPEVREKTNEEVTCTVSNDGVYTLTVSDTVQSDRILSFSYNPVETPDGKTWVVAAFAENILDDNGMITLGDAIHPVASAYIRNNGYNVNRASSPSATKYILDRMAITVRAGTPAGTFTLRPMLMYIEPTDPPVPLPALPTVDGTNIVDYAGQSAEFPSRFTAKYRKEGF